MPVAQAEAQAKALGDVLSKTVASAGDLVVLEANLAAKIDALESKLDAKIARSESGLNIKIEGVRNELKLDIQKLGGSIDTLKWMVGFVATLNIGIFIKLILNH